VGERTGPEDPDKQLRAHVDMLERVVRSLAGRVDDLEFALGLIGQREWLARHPRSAAPRATSATR
jgi:hypothetical protein